MTLPIDPIILKKRSAIPGMIAKLSYVDQKKAIEYMRIWGEHKMAITPLHAELTVELSRMELEGESK